MTVDLSTAVPITPASRFPWGKVAVVAALAATSLIGPYVLDPYLVNVLIRSFFYASVALTVDLLWGYTGILTFGQSTFFGIGAYAAALVFTHFGFDAGAIWLALLGGIAVAVAVAALVGWLAFFYGATPLYIAVVTLVLPIVATQLVLSGGTFTGSSSGMVGFEVLDVSVEAWFSIAAIGLLTLTVGAWIFVNSEMGRLLVAIRDNEQRCQYLGISSSRVKTYLMMATAAVAAVAGFGYANFTMVVAPELTGFVFGTELVIWVALSGRGTLIGPVLGTILLDVVSAYLSGSMPFVWKLFIGFVFVGVILFLPNGLVPMFGGFIRAGLRRVGWWWHEAAPVADIVPIAHDVEGVQAYTDAPALEVAHLEKRFGSLTVLEDINLVTRPGELVSLVGPNGAGKTTMIRCLSDGFERTTGSVVINGNRLERQPPHDCVAFGVGRKFQAANVFDSLTVADCLRLARKGHEPLSPFRRSRTLNLPEPAVRVIKTTGLDKIMGTEARHLSHGMKQALELSMVLALEPSVLMLDEPTAGLTKTERHLIGDILMDLAKHDAFCILLVEHDLDFVRQISTRVVVLHHGRLVLDGSVADVVGSDLVQEIYAGSGKFGESE